MNEGLDKIMLKIFPEVPCLSPNRYTGFIILKEILTSLLKRGKESQILDAGCGRGVYADFLKELGVKGSYLGIDLEFKQDVSAFKETQNFKIKFKRVNLNKFNLKQKFDLILSLWTLEHLKDDLGALELLKNHLKEQGWLILAVPSFYTWPFEFGRHGFHYYSLDRVKQLVKRAGFKIIKFKKCGGPFGWLFVLCYDWLSFLVVIPVLGCYKILGKLPKKKTREDLGSAQLSRTILNNTIFAYKKIRIGRKRHYNLVRRITQIDSCLPFLESSYFLVLKRKR